MSSIVPVVYLAHPVGAADRAGVARNLESARRWLAVLLELWPEAALVVSWLPYLDVLEDSGASRRRGLRDDLAVVRRCDGIVLCGPVVSAGMGLELDVALAARGFVLELIGVDVDDRDTIRERILQLGATDPRALGGEVVGVCCKCKAPIPREVGGRRVIFVTLGDQVAHLNCGAPPAG